MRREKHNSCDIASKELKEKQSEENCLTFKFSPNLFHGKKRGRGEEKAVLTWQLLFCCSMNGDVQNRSKDR